MPAIATKPFETKPLGAEPDATAPDGTAVRLLLSLRGGSMAHFELPAGAVSHAVSHRTVEEIWFVTSGRGSIWRRQDDLERIEALSPGAALTIPLGTAFQFRAEGEAPLAFVAITMPPWPGMEEALPAEGPWAPTVAAGPA
jgi:mannose-6-phosphate isomerase-like protein (cupin superfamily)